MRKNVTKISWRIRTGNQWWSGTNDRVDLEIYRDNELLQRASIEPGRTPRLDRGEVATYLWQFRDNDGIQIIISGTPLPHYEVFPDGIEGHLSVKIIARGDDAWEKGSIFTSVFTGQLRLTPGSIDDFEWVEERKDYNFGQEVVMSTDRSEGIRSLRLLY